jgi:N6-L-threonylcarbamoyladenine synthase
MRAGDAASLTVYLPPPRLCNDNAEMIGSAAFYRLMALEVAFLSLNADPTARLSGLGGAE